MNRRAAYWLCILGTIAVALFLRGGDLAFRPLHNDEAINAVKLQGLWQSGDYRYDPHEYHGPTLYYLSLPVLRMASWFEPDQPGVASMRAVTVVCGLGLVAACWLASTALGRWAALGAALLTAVSPSMVYFSRYYIHEPFLVLFSALALAGVHRYQTRAGTWAAVGIGVAVGLMYATKETFPFAIAAMVAGGVLAAATLPGTPSDGVQEGIVRARLRTVLGAVSGIRPWHVAVALMAFTLVAVLFFTSFLRHPGGAWDAVRTYIAWGERARGATPHVHPWTFYLERLLWFRMGTGPIWSEAAIFLLAAAGVGLGWKRGLPGGSGPVPVRFLTGYTVTLAAIYSAIPYKTPWCMLGFLHGTLWLAGAGAWGLVHRFRGALPRCGVVLSVLGASVHLGYQAMRANGDFAADFRNPHVYGHTSMDVVNLLELVDGVVAAQPEGNSTPLTVAVPESSYWPLPWYFRRMGQAGWYEALPARVEPGIVITAVKLRANLEEREPQTWMQVGMFELRPRFFVEVHVERTRWSRFLETRRGTGPSEGR